MRLFKPLLLLTTIVYLMAGCRSTSRRQAEYGLPSPTIENILFTDLQIDSLTLDKFPSSMVGELKVEEEKLLFVDYRFCKLFYFSTSGSMISKHVGQGSSNTQLPTGAIEFYNKLKNGRRLFVGSGWDCHEFDQDIKRVEDYIIDWKLKENPIDLSKNPSPTNKSLYSLLYINHEVRPFRQGSLFPITSQHPTFNPLSGYFLKEAKIFAYINDEGAVEDLYGSYPPIYTLRDDLHCFAFFSFDVSVDDQVIVSFPLDTLVHLFDSDFSFIKSFGQKARYFGEPTFYKVPTSVAAFKKTCESEIRERSHFTNVKYFQKTSTFFRSYSRGKHEEKDGLQIYKNDTLIGDVQVPKRFKVVGYIAPFYYTDVYYSEKTGRLHIYKFKLF